MNLVGRRVGAVEDMALNQRLLKEDKVGAEDTYICYPTGWTQVSNTPYRFFKRTPMAGGIRVPLVVHWPAGIADRGALRRLYRQDRARDGAPSGRGLGTSEPVHRTPGPGA